MMNLLESVNVVKQSHIYMIIVVIIVEKEILYFIKYLAMKLVWIEPMKVVIIKLFMIQMNV